MNLISGGKRPPWHRVPSATPASTGMSSTTNMRVSRSMAKIKQILRQAETVAAFIATSIRTGCRPMR